MEGAAVQHTWLIWSFTHNPQATDKVTASDPGVHFAFVSSHSLLLFGSTAEYHLCSFPHPHTAFSRPLCPRSSAALSLSHSLFRPFITLSPQGISTPSSFFFLLLLLVLQPVMSRPACVSTPRSLEQPDQTTATTANDSCCTTHPHEHHTAPHNTNNTVL